MGRVGRWAPVALWAAVLLGASSRQTLPVDLHSGTDKIAHFLAYSVLGFLLSRATRGRHATLRAILLGSLLGALDELYQSTVPGRHASVGDWVADTLGVIAGALAYLGAGDRAERLLARARGGRRDPESTST